ncbi:protein kinase domain-containing protein [Nocardia alni]|uniref:serine/threonine-protein kinase n=1 Tax=Nocardia alni TaxID=2815723 RepID=UPI001C251283|nr:serine/threonine-protein kinase [Nocardia alni]
MQTPGDALADLFVSSSSVLSASGPLGQLGDDLDILEIRRGGMGEVLICRPRNSGEALGSAGGAVAYKTFQRRLFFRPHIRAAFLREVRLWSRLTGVPHIMPVLGFENVEGRPFVIMPAILGNVRSLRDVTSGPTLDPWFATLLAAQIALGMHLAGERVAGLVHGDLKPENVLLVGNIVHISDFGLARAAGESHTLAGTAAYQSPELQADPSTANVSSDVYAFGVLFWELLTGDRPQDGDLRAEPDSALAALACTCLAANPSQRPSFAEIYCAILRTAGRHMPGLTTQIMDATARPRLVLEALAPLLAKSRLESLLNLEEYDLAIEEADALPEFLVTPEVLTLRGQALSLAGRDKEAIGDFDRALGCNPDRGITLSCQIAKGLSLKRLGRYDDAIELLRRTVADMPDDQRGPALINLATVYLERGDHGKALPLLLWACKLAPDTWQVWGNLGHAYEGISDYHKAETAYQRAVQLAPHEALPALRLAAVCMDHLDRTEVAWAVLEQLSRQGHTTPAWAARVWACLLVGGHSAEEVDKFAVRVCERWPEGASAIAGEAHRLAAGIAAPKVPLTAPSMAPVVSRDPRNSFADIQASLPPGWEMTHLRERGEPGWKPNPLSNPEGAAAYSVARDGEMFLGVRVYMMGGFHCFDFFGSPEQSGYLDRLVESLATARSLIETMMPTCRRREIPPYYHRCPACRVLVLTDRTPGVMLRCRSCAESAPTNPLHAPEFDDLARRAANRLGHEIIDVSGAEQLMLAEVPTSPAAKPMAVLASWLGFEPVELSASAPRELLMMARSMQMPNLGERTVVAFRKLAGPGVLTYDHGQTPDLEELEFLVRATIGPTWSVSTCYDPRGESFLEMEFAGRHDDLLADLRARVASDPHDQTLRKLLAWHCLRHGLMDDAHEAARVCIERWPEDAESWLVWAEVRRATGDPAGGIDAIQRSLSVDPVQPHAFALLAQCHADLGDAGAAASAATQAFGLGGGNAQWTS